jgi:hypothetical protein
LEEELTSLIGQLNTTNGAATDEVTREMEEDDLQVL